jgi:Pyruvate/2-oxoacid:ferredoxin oxidoreductase gamma subunit
VAKDTMVHAIEEVLGSKRHLLDINMNALDEGIKFVTEACGSS